METLNLYKILENCPKDTILYSPIYGNVKLLGIDKFSYFGIKIKTSNQDGIGGEINYLSSEGKTHTNGECMLFPSKDNRDWSTFNTKKFDVNELTPFQQVLVREYPEANWCIDFFSHIENDRPYKFVTCGGIHNQYCIPFNGDTRHLIGTTLPAPDFYDV